MSYAQITIEGRRALLDALAALRAHRDALILVGAQAIYLYTGDHDVATATITKDSDLVVDPHRLVPDPLLQDAMTSAGFTHDLERLAHRTDSPSSSSSPPVSNQAALAAPESHRTASAPPAASPASKPQPSTTG